jgi:hypothetical protein
MRVHQPSFRIASLLQNYFELKMFHVFYVIQLLAIRLHFLSNFTFNHRHVLLLLVRMPLPCGILFWNSKHQYATCEIRASSSSVLKETCGYTEDFTDIEPALKPPRIELWHA